MQKDKDELTIGVLDIYGFEIFMVGWWVWSLHPLVVNRIPHLVYCRFSVVGCIIVT